ncbi:hypothetical protein NADFUDRAFT_77245 [Nadsonia fulvescens var. elongata DSM 6958]|uniref:Uncharacterized protein n=1 Tax=Nadsonia fulvescens var. elongata DSM 6958 TaxID=857566 RepID=A0A1E3PPK2_9ASCO|nr:hypothetical protein NADFUDRAFT_77245 [Nadsonia fulvescens var. elongata DSM 6958]
MDKVKSIMENIEPKLLLKRLLPDLVDSVVGNGPTSGLLTRLSPLLRTRYSFETFDSHLGWICGLTWQNDLCKDVSDDADESFEANYFLKFLDMFIQDLTEFYSHSDDVESYIQQRHKSDYFRKLDNDTFLTKILLDLGLSAGENKTVGAAIIFTWNSDEKSWLLHDIYEENNSDQGNNNLNWSVSIEEARKIFVDNSDIYNSTKSSSDCHSLHTDDNEDNAYWDQYDDIGSDDDDNKNLDGNVLIQKPAYSFDSEKPTSELSDDDDYYSQYDKVETQVTDKYENTIVGVTDEKHPDSQVDHEILEHISESMTLLCDLAKKKGIPQKDLQNLMNKRIELVYK